jgi:hypothetical protein|tara:strand:+ start:860 stop:2209 length:1350 start_codon:yes stop_codon:yes gene_type:complete
MANQIPIQNAPINNQLISTFDFDIRYPQKRRTLIRQYGDQGEDMFSYLLDMGYVEPVASMEYSNYQEDYIHNTVLVGGAVAASAAGADISIPVDPSTVKNGRIYAYEGLYVLDPITYSTGRIMAVTGASPNFSLTVRPHDASGVFGPFVQGQELVIFSGSVGESSGFVEGSVSEPLEYFFSLQRIREGMTVSDDQLTQQVWIDNDSDGNPIGAYYRKGQAELDYRMALKVSNAALWGQLTTNPALEDDSMLGVMQWAKSGGNFAYHTPGNFPLANFDLTARVLKKYGSANEMSVFAGIGFMQDVENLFADILKSDAKIFAAGGKTGVDLGINISTLEKSGFRFHFMNMCSFDNPKLAGAPGYNGENIGLFVPMGSTKVSKGFEGGSRTVPYMGMRYSALDGVNRKFHVWETGGFAAQNKNETANLRMHQLAVMGTEFAAAKSFFVWFGQ